MHALRYAYDGSKLKLVICLCTSSADLVTFADYMQVRGHECLPDAKGALVIPRAPTGISLPPLLLT